MKLSNMTTLEKAHAEIDRIYFDIFSKHGMEVRDGQIALCHNMLNAFADKRISLCHAGVGVGKTSAYLVAAVVWNKYRPCDASEHFSPFVIATSSIALQNAILEDYIPQLSDILCGEGVIDEPFEGILRKGKGNYVCPMRLARRIENINPDKRNKEKLDALLALRLNMDLGKAPRLSKYDKVRVAIPDTCPRSHEWLSRRQKGGSHPGAAWGIPIQFSFRTQRSRARRMLPSSSSPRSARKGARSSVMPSRSHWLVSPSRAAA